MLNREGEKVEEKSTHYSRVLLIHSQSTKPWVEVTSEPDFCSSDGAMPFGCPLGLSWSLYVSTHLLVLINRVVLRYPLHGANIPSSAIFIYLENLSVQNKLSCQDSDKMSLKSSS